MGVLKIISGIVIIIVKIVGIWISNNTEKNAQNKEAIREAIEAIDKRDTSKLNRAIGGMR